HERTDEGDHDDLEMSAPVGAAKGMIHRPLPRIGQSSRRPRNVPERETTRARGNNHCTWVKPCLSAGIEALYPRIDLRDVPGHAGGVRERRAGCLDAAPERRHGPMTDMIGGGAEPHYTNVWRLRSLPPPRSSARTMDRLPFTVLMWLPAMKLSGA